ncbi:TM0106 family RecB-like putative nuclease [Brevundimonas diminuta]|uniref:TM0106 family RecB-like putative nuclease n=1 Tax=Brevundimonas diminuta TaxID=293 RepID=UPI003CFD2D42
MKPLLSASRLNNFQACPHHAALWLAGEKAPERAEDTLTLVRSKGFDHEAKVLADLAERHGDVFEVTTTGSLEERKAQTLEAMRRGAPLIYQAAFADERWIGFPDFLVRTGQGADGRWLYDPEDAKLAKKAKADHVVQLGVYAALLEPVTGAYPRRGVIHVSAPEPAVFDLNQTRHITQRLMQGFEAFADQAERATRPVKTSACGQCDFAERCTAEWRAADSPVFVANIRGDQIIKLEKAGVATLTELAALPADRKIPGIGEETLAKLTAQARLQKRAEETQEHTVEVLPVAPARGFALLPSPAAGDLFYDIEGDPLYPERLEYLHGLWGPLSENGEDGFVEIWAHDHEEEKAAFERLIDLFTAHLERYPQARIYHYAAYEQTALKRLAMRYATRETELDHLLRTHRFVDLYQVARQGIRASTESYSLKALEKIYWGKRAGEVTNAGDSIIEYERWRETQDPAILEAIARYNEDDCVSTAKLRDWLESLRPEDAVYGLAEDETPEDRERAEKREAFEAERNALAARVRAQSALEPEIRELIAELLWFHQRAQKPQLWAMFDRQAWTDEELLDDAESLGKLTLLKLEPDKRSYLATYAFPPQDTKLKPDDTPKFAIDLERAGSIVEIDPEAGRVVLRRGMTAGDFPVACSLIPGTIINQKPLVEALMAFATRMADGVFEYDQATLDFLRRVAPRLKNAAPGAAVIHDGEDLVVGVTRAVRDLDDSTLLIQGPPGTGKTYTTSHAIVSLLEQGKRVGVSSNSHKAINNLLAAISKHAVERGVRFNGAKKGTRDKPETFFEEPGFTTVLKSEEVDEGGYDLVGATAFHFATDGCNAFDYLFVDEAGQVSLGNLIAMAGCAKNLVLVGDQMQLPQPVQGVHPGDTGLSTLDYALRDQATVPPERGVLLDVSWRMHPAVCSFISDAIYDGRLKAHPQTKARRLELNAGSPLKPAGIVQIALAHEGSTQSAIEEAREVARLLQDLLPTSWNNGSESRRLSLDDVLVVSPFNMQVDLLRRTLPKGTRVGTVDKFQGQEAPVVIISMATSFGGDAPRGTEFLFNRNRLNVAISRAKSLAIVVHSERLMDLPSPSLEDLPRLDLFARIEKASREAA